MTTTPIDWLPFFESWYRVGGASGLIHLATGAMDADATLCTVPAQSEQIIDVRIPGDTWVKGGTLCEECRLAAAAGIGINPVG